VNTRAFTMQLIAIAFAIIVAPLLIGWVNQCRAWLQNRRGPGILQPYRLIRKLFHKDAVIATNASPLFRLVPYVQFASMGLAAGIIPSLWTGLPFADAADTIALVGLFATARMFLALAAMDIGTAFGSMGARREMLVGFLAEPALLMVFFTASLISHSTSLPTMVNVLAHGPLAIYPSLAFASISFLMVLLAENARIPVDNPSTHLELTMIHEATVLEYSARHLALIEWASALKLFNYVCIGFALFVPWGLAQGLGNLPDLAIAVPALFIKLVAVGFGLALVETINAKMRIFRVPEFLASAFLLAVLGLLVHLLLGH
jgi:formate hydrogenlyase subunit 4